MCANWQPIYRGCTIASEGENGHMSLWDKRILEQFADIKETQSFQELVLVARKTAGLPPEGLNPDRLLEEDEPFFHWEIEIPKKSVEYVEKEAERICDELRVGHHLATIIVMYIAQGEKFDKGMQPFVVETTGCYLTQWGNEFIIGIRPDATKNQVKAFIDANWDEIAGYFKQLYPEGFKRVKKKTKRIRDKNIIELYEQGVLTAIGLVNQKKALEYFKDSSLQPPYGPEDVAKYLGIKLPGPDAIKKVIERYRKLRRK